MATRTTTSTTMKTTMSAPKQTTTSSDEEDDNEGSLEEEMRDLQADLGDDWILRFSVQGEDTWLTAEKDDGSQHVEAPAAAVLADVVELLNESGGRSN